MSEFRLVVTGSKKFSNYIFLKSELDKFISSIKSEKPLDVVIVNACSVGTETLAQIYSKERGLKFECFEGDWNGKGTAAQAKKVQMIESSDCCVVFKEEGKSDPVTKLCASLGIVCEIVKV